MKNEERNGSHSNIVQQDQRTKKTQIETHIMKIGLLKIEKKMALLTINLTLTSGSCIPGDQTAHSKNTPNENDKLP